MPARSPGPKPGGPSMNGLPEGFRHLPAYLDTAAQRSLVEEIRAVVEAAPLYRPEMPRTGKAMSVRMTNCGPLGWVTDRTGGYRYQAVHPVTGLPWPPIPLSLLAIWRDVAPAAPEPEACLVNFYDADARMGLHQDRDELELTAPVVSVSLGDSCLFRIGSAERGGPTSSLRLQRRCGSARGQRPARLPRRRQDLSRYLRAAAPGRPDQPDPQARDCSRRFNGSLRRQT